MKKIGSGLKSPKALQAAPELIEVQAFMPMDPADLARLKADIMASGEIRDPLKIYLDRRTGNEYILGGYNRWQIALELGITPVPVDYYEGIPPEPTPAELKKIKQGLKDLVINDNLNRRHLTAEQKRKLITHFLEQDPAQSNKSIAKKTGTTKETVKAQREQLETRGRISPPDKVKGTDGKQYKKPAVKPAAPRPAAPLKSDVKRLIREYIQAQRDTRAAARDLIDYIKTLG
jgi:hypothetical protein